MEWSIPGFEKQKIIEGQYFSFLFVARLFGFVRGDLERFWPGDS
jgi:hypothetical protein